MIRAALSILTRYASIEAELMLRRVMRRAVLFAVAAILLLLALGALTAAAILGLAPVVGAWQAALIVGVVLILLALLVLALTRRPGRRVRVARATVPTEAAPAATSTDQLLRAFEIGYSVGQGKDK